MANELWTTSCRCSVQIAIYLYQYTPTVSNYTVVTKVCQVFAYKELNWLTFLRVVVYTIIDKYQRDFHVLRNFINNDSSMLKAFVYKELNWPMFLTAVLWKKIGKYRRQLHISVSVCRNFDRSKYNSRSNCWSSPYLRRVYHFQDVVWKRALWKILLKDKV